MAGNAVELVRPMRDSDYSEGYQPPQDHSEEKACWKQDGIPYCIDILWRGGELHSGNEQALRGAHRYSFWYGSMHFGGGRCVSDP